MRLGKTLILALLVGMVVSPPERTRAKTVIPPQKIQIKAKIYFASQQVTISKAGLMVLKEVGLALRDHPELTLIRVEGHCDVRESRQGRKFGLKRARAVAKHLTQRWKISPKRLKVVDYGPTRPVDTNRTAHGRARNRRVSFTILTVRGKPNGSRGSDPL